MPRAGRSRRNSHARDGSRASVSRARARDARGDSPDGCAVTVGCLSPLTPGNCASRTAEPGLDHRRGEGHAKVEGLFDESGLEEVFYSRRDVGQGRRKRVERSRRERPTPMENLAIG